MRHARCIHDVTMMHQLHNMYKCNAYFTMPAQCQHDALPNLEKIIKTITIIYYVVSQCLHNVNTMPT